VLYPINFPAKAPVTERLALNRRQSGTESPWTYARQTVQTASQWVLEWTWPPMSFLKAEEIDAWLLSLKGQIGSFTYAPRQRYASALTGVTLAQTGYAYNNSVQMSGWAANAETTLRRGQWLQIGTQLLKVIEGPAFADASGQVTISFEPELRVIFAAGTVVNFDNPKGVFALGSSDGVTYTLNPDKLPVFGTMSAREVV